ncbi:arginine/serine-rich protein 1 [Xenentodon cancila]
MAEKADPHSDMAQARQSDGINVIFDQKSPGSHHSRSRSPSSSASTRSSCSSGSGYYRGRHRSSSSSSSATSSSSASSSRSRSRSHPRCRRRSSRCRCDDHYRSRSGHRYRSPRRRYRARSRSHKRSRTPDGFSRHRRYYSSRSRSRSSRHGRREDQFGVKFSQSPSISHRGRSRSRAYGSSVSLSLHDKRELLEAAKANAMKMLGVEKLELPESVKPILSDSRRLSPEPTARVRHGPQGEVSQDTETEPRMPSPKMSPKGKITFSINNSVAKPTVAAPSSAKVTPRVDSYEGKRPYGYWIPIGSGKTSSARKRTKTMPL